MAQTAAQLVGPCLEKICEIASGRKFTKLRHEAKVSDAEVITHLTCKLDMGVERLIPCIVEACLQQRPVAPPELMNQFAGAFEQFRVRTAPCVMGSCCSCSIGATG